MKDYYKILGLTPGAGDDQIRQSYRRLAMQYHPDRNPDNPQAEEQFKEIAEAYGVLTDPVKRRRYEAARRSGKQHGAGGRDSGFHYSQEDILRDLFQDPRFHLVLQGVLRQFQRSGFRAGPTFLRRTFFGGRAGFLVGGLFFVGSLVGPAVLGTLKSQGKAAGQGGGLVGGLARGFGSLLSGRSTAPASARHDDLHIVYHIPVSARELQDGKWVQVAVVNERQEQELLKVKIPPGSCHGRKLRLKGKGRMVGSARRGDLFLILDKPAD
ncbi:MAG: hypothetical protein C0613_11340 [Desulfobulbaceae bacterium]|nr:MAG: hypothetical protein C0613_11340 [Desulfobulbaceae bacterium]